LVCCSNGEDSGDVRVEVQNADGPVAVSDFSIHTAAAAEGLEGSACADRWDSVPVELENPSLLETWKTSAKAKRHIQRCRHAKPRRPGAPPGMNFNDRFDSLVSDETLVPTLGERSDQECMNITIARPPRPTAVDAQQLPVILQLQVRWLPWRYSEHPNALGKYEEIPYDLSDNPADHLDPTTWQLFWPAHDQYFRGNYDGIGVMLGKVGHGYWLCCLHEDNYCRLDAEQRVELASKHVRILDSYSELSLDGTGVNVVALGSLPDRGRKIGDHELHCDLRFLPVTGRRLDESPSTVEYRETELHALYRLLFPAEVERGADGGHFSDGYPVASDDCYGTGHDEYVGSIDDDGCVETSDLDELAATVDYPDAVDDPLPPMHRDAAVMAALRRDHLAWTLWTGGRDDRVKDYWALLYKLAFYSSKNEVQMARLFRRSMLWSSEYGLILNTEEKTSILQHDIKIVCMNQVEVWIPRDRRTGRPAGRPRSERTQQALEAIAAHPSLSAKHIGKLIGESKQFVANVRRRAGNTTLQMAQNGGNTTPQRREIPQMGQAILHDFVSDCNHTCLSAAESPGEAVTQPTVLNTYPSQVCSATDGDRPAPGSFNPSPRQGNDRRVSADGESISAQAGVQNHNRQADPSQEVIPSDDQTFRIRADEDGKLYDLDVVMPPRPEKNRTEKDGRLGTTQSSSPAKGEVENANNEPNARKERSLKVADAFTEEDMPYLDDLGDYERSLEFYPGWSDDYGPVDLDHDELVDDHAAENDCAPPASIRTEYDDDFGDVIDPKENRELSKWIVWYGWEVAAEVDPRYLDGLSPAATAVLEGKRRPTRSRQENNPTPPTPASSDKADLSRTVEVPTNNKLKPAEPGEIHGLRSRPS
jgi:hypothetical protein